MPQILPLNSMHLIVIQIYSGKYNTKFDISMYFYILLNEHFWNEIGWLLFMVHQSYADIYEIDGNNCFLALSLSLSLHLFTFKCGKIDHLTQTFLSWTSANFAYIIIDIFFTLTRAFIGNFISMPIRYVPTRIWIQYKIVDYNGIIFAVFPVNHFCSKSSHYVEEEEDKICCLESCRSFLSKCVS